MSQIIYEVAARSGAHPRTLPEGAPWKLRLPPGIRKLERPWKNTVEIDTDSEVLNRLAWARAADILTRHPPGLPILAPANPFTQELTRLWADWRRVVVNLAIRSPDFLEPLVVDLASNNPESIAAAIQSIFEQWREDFPVDLWGIYCRAKALARPGHEFPRLSPDALANRQIPLPTPDPGNHSAVIAMATVFIWRKGISGDASSGLLESRWVHWPSTGDPRLSVRLLVQGVPLWSSYGHRQPPSP